MESHWSPWICCMEPWALPRPPPMRRSRAAGSERAEGRHGTPLPLRPILPGPLPRPGSWDPGRDLQRPASRAESYEGGHAFRAYSRQGYEDPHWQYPAAAYRDNHVYQSHQWQPTAWQGDRDVTQVKPHSRSTAYRDQHYYRGYHPNLAASPSGQDRSQTYDAYREGSRHSWAGVSNLGEATGQPQEPSLLQQYRESGLSSSGYELSQYIRDEAEPNNTAFLGGWSPVQRGGPSESAVMAPHKFLQPHVPVCLGAGGQLVLVCPHHPAEGQLPLVELHSLEVILQGTKDQEELQAFPGPLAREDLHKVDVMTFCQQKIASSCDLSTQRGRDSALLWKLLVLLCRQNGSMVGSDVAELLMQDRRQQERYKRQEPALGPVSLADEEWHQLGTLDLITGEVPPVVETQAQIVEKFTKLLYYGRKKDALVWAMRNQLWGHALFLSSKMDPRTYSWVLTGFTSTLATNDPLQTFFQLMSGRIPQAAQVRERQAGWSHCPSHPPHDNHPASPLLPSPPELWGCQVGRLEASPGRAVVQQGGRPGAEPPGHRHHGRHLGQAFTQFATTEAIQRMEIFEYCQQLQHPTSFLLLFQVYKFLYASRLADHGLPAQALLYCEQIATVLLQQDPTSHPVLAQQLTKLAERLKLCDPLLLEMPEQDLVLEPEWLLQLRSHCQHCEVQDDLAPEVAPTQPEPWDTAATPGREMDHKLLQSDGPQHEQWYQPPVPLQGPDPHQDVSIQPLEVAVLGMGPTSQEELCPEPSLQAVPTAGNAEEPQDAHGMQQPVLAEPELMQQELTRARSASESSTASLEEGSQTSSDSTAEELEETSEDKSSGFRWFGWFRSKPQKETSPKATTSGSPTPGLQDRRSPSPPGAVPSAQPPASPSPYRNPVSIDMKGQWDADGQEPSSQQPLPGMVPLFNPAQVSQLAAARPTQPRLLSQHRYPNPL
uniref:Protein transport protein sec16 n=1 Tax=Phasianus colchicus TaxID=9054 RepID=A0A669PM50_PHACC